MIFLYTDGLIQWTTEDAVSLRVLVPAENLEIQLVRGNGGTATIIGNLQPNSGDRKIMQSSAVEIMQTGGHPMYYF